MRDENFPLNLQEERILSESLTCTFCYCHPFSGPVYALTLLGASTLACLQKLALPHHGTFLPEYYCVKLAQLPWDSGRSQHDKLGQYYLFLFHCFAVQVYPCTADQWVSSYVAKCHASRSCTRCDDARCHSSVLHCVLFLSFLFQIPWSWRTKCSAEEELVSKNQLVVLIGSGLDLKLEMASSRMCFVKYAQNKLQPKVWPLLIHSSFLSGENLPVNFCNCKVIFNLSKICVYSFNAGSGDLIYFLLFYFFAYADSYVLFAESCFFLCGSFVLEACMESKIKLWKNININ